MCAEGDEGDASEAVADPIPQWLAMLRDLDPLLRGFTLSGPPGR
jgi:hypothetical protein